MTAIEPRYPPADGWTWAFAPGTVSNVGCGFDVLGFAVEGPGDRVAARRAEGAGIRILAVEGDGGRLPRDAERNTAGVVARALLQAVGCDAGVELVVEKGMPLASGLGSSAASGVAAAVAVDAALGLGASRDVLLRAAVEGERVACGSPHPDNAAPSLWGGFVLVRPGDDGPLVTPLPVPAGLACALVRPHVAVETGPSRALLGDKVPLAAAVRQWGNVGALVAALFRGDLALLASSLHDAVAEPLRGPRIPGFAAVKAAALAAGALGCSLSGSGPSVFALAADRPAAERTLAAMAAALAGAGLRHDAFVSAVGTRGAHLIGA